LLAAIGPIIGTGMALLQSNAMWSRMYKPAAGGQFYQYTYSVKTPTGMVQTFARISASQYRHLVPQPWSWDFFKTIIIRTPYNLAVFPSLIEILAWPWMTLLSLLVFQASMRRARIKTGHVLRCAIYGCDFSFLLAAILVALSFSFGWRDRSDAFVLMMICPLVALYRLTFAYKRYLRFNHPFFTVLASQVMVFLATFVVLLNWTQWW
jgi:hypothetical protein